MPLAVLSFDVTRLESKSVQKFLFPAISPPPPRRNDMKTSINRCKRAVFAFSSVAFVVVRVKQFFTLFKE
jgi:hypothetical protein